MYYLRKFGGLSVFALVVAVPSLAFANSVLTSQTYVDAKVQAQGSTTGSILSASSPDDKAPSSKAVYTALQGIDGATPYTGTGLITVNDHEISTTAQVNVLEGVQIAGVDQNITSKKVNLGAAAGKAVDTSITAGSTSTDVPTTAAVAAYVANQPGATAYTGTGLISVNDHTISTTAEANVLEGVQIAGVDQNITSKKVNLGAAAGKAVDTSITAGSTSTDVPTTAAVAAYVANQPGATAYTGTGLISVNDHTISTTAEQNVQADWDEATTTSDAYIANKPTIVNAATDITGATSADTKELPTTYAVQQYVTTAAAASNFVEDSITDGVTAKAPSENAVHDALVNKQTKPASGVASGKVLTYTGTDANANVSADYVKVPNFDPSGTIPNNPTFSYFWVQ